MNENDETEYFQNRLIQEHQRQGQVVPVRKIHVGRAMRDLGAHFYRCDFQVHTPRDAAWKGQHFTTDAERQAYAASFVGECRRTGLHAVAITDHHDLVFAPIIRKAAAEELDTNGQPLPESDRLVVFPGVELTLGVPCQALLILDADIADDRLPLVLEALAIQAHDPAATSLPDVTRLDHINSLKTLHEVLDQREWLRGRYIVFPNVTDGGLGSLMRTGMQAKYKEMPCVGGYLDGSVEKVGSGNASKFAGKDSKWGNKSIAVFQTSDSRDASFSTLAEHSTWVKWARPTAEALRQACLAGQSRISHVEPQLPNVTISRIIVNNSKFMGPIDLVFNDQYNAIIGGRGTGKSTVLGYLRWALCDQPIEEESDTEVANPGARQRRLIETTLSPYDAQVEVHFVINEIPLVVRRHSSTGEILLKVGSDEFKPARESDIRALLPIHAYSQKQLSSVSVRIEELTRFITAPIQRRLDDIDRHLAETTGRLRENYATLQRARTLTKSVDRSELTVRSLAEQAANLRRSLTGLSETDQLLLGSKPSHDAAREMVRATLRELTTARTAVETAISQVESAPQPTLSESLPEALRGSAAALQDEARAAMSRLASMLRTAVENFDTAQAADSALGTHRRTLEEALREFDSAYAAVKARSTAHEERLKELSQLEEAQAQALELLEQQRVDLNGLGDPSGYHDRLRTDLLQLARQRSDAMAEQCSELSNLSDGLLRADLRRGIGLADVQSKFRSLIAGSNVRGARVEALFESLKAESDPLSTWDRVLSELEQILLLEPDSEISSEMTPVLSRLGFPPPEQARIQSRLTPDGWLDLALTHIKDYPVFEYRIREAEYIDFGLASAGQQATALLRVLLAQAGMPLVIDQPEDDLDSQVVLDVVERIWAAKPKRQLIFTSHNANLVVNGDAELVVVCDNRSAVDQSGGEIRFLGAIDIPEVRSAITRIMEGGERAFKLRKEKYGF